MSQIVWETMIPTITATDIAYDNVINITKISKIFPKLTNLNLKNLGQLSSQIQFPKIINLGGGSGSGSVGSGGSSSSSSSSSLVTGGNGGGGGKVE